jgi:hypothetical protein
MEWAAIGAVRALEATKSTQSRRHFEACKLRLRLGGIALRQIAALHRRRVSDRVVERESRALESAVRAELWRLVLSPPLTPPGVA